MSPGGAHSALGVVEGEDQLTQQVGQHLPLRFGQSRENGPFLGEQVGKGRVGSCRAVVGERNDDAASVVRIRMPLHQSTGSQPVDPIGHGP